MIFDVGLVLWYQTTDDDGMGLKVAKHLRHIGDITI